MNRAVKILLSLLILSLFSGCATIWQVNRLEEKLDRLLQATKRSTLENIFGNQATEITNKLDELDDSQRDRFDNIQMQYEKGATTIEEVRGKMLGVLGGGDRVVSTTRGIYVRDEIGEKLKAISNGAKIKNCKLLDEENIPEIIKEKKYLMRFAWGIGEYKDEMILFPWELTISNFTKEIVEHTAKRTAQEFIKMGGEKRFNRPIHIQISTEKEDQLKISTKEDETEVYFVPSKEEEPKEKPKE